MSAYATNLLTGRIVLHADLVAVAIGNLSDEQTRRLGALLKHAAGPSDYCDRVTTFLMREYGAEKLHEMYREYFPERGKVTP